jgi:DNA polymerase-3 subunit epsilon
VRLRRRRPWREERYLVVDVETTGLSPRRGAEIVSFAAIPVDGGRVQPGQAITGLVRPRRAPDAETVRIHGLRPVDLAAAPAAREALAPLLAALHGRIPVAHAAWFDAAFVREYEPWWRRLRRPRFLRRAWIDTAALGRLLAVLGDEPDPTPLSLSSLAERLGVPAAAPHDAFGDALTTAQAFVAVATLLDRIDPQTAGTLLDARRRLKALAPEEGAAAP